MCLPVASISKRTAQEALAKVLPHTKTSHCDSFRKTFTIQRWSERWYSLSVATRHMPHGTLRRRTYSNIPTLNASVCCYCELTTEREWSFEWSVVTEMLYIPPYVLHIRASVYIRCTYVYIYVYVSTQWEYIRILHFGCLLFFAIGKWMSGEVANI